MISKLEVAAHAKNMRRNIVKMVANASSGHPGGSLSATDILAWLYFNEMDINETNFDTIDRDRFVLSKGHASPALYAVLHEKNILDVDLMTFRKINTRLQGHPNMQDVAAVDMSTGSLGQGLAASVGMALANRLDKNDHRIYCLLGDGECQEGMVWEAAMAAGHFKLDNLCAIVDFNGLQIDGKVTDVMNPTPFDKKFEAFNWNVVCIDGHNFDEIEMAFAKARECKDMPTVIIANTVKGKGISFMENQASWHGVAPNADQLAAALKELED